MSYQEALSQLHPLSPHLGWMPGAGTPWSRWESEGFPLSEWKLMCDTHHTPYLSARECQVQAPRTGAGPTE